MDDWPYEALIHKLKAVLAEVEARPPARPQDRLAGGGDAEEAPRSVSPAVTKPLLKRVVEP